MYRNWDTYKLPAAVALLVILIITLFMGKKHGYTVDANASFQITKEIVESGTLFPDTAVKQGYLYSIVYIPFYLLAQPLHLLFPDVPLMLMQRKMLCWMNTVFTGLTAGVLCCLLRTMRYSKHVQLLLPLIYAFSTLAFTYARYDYNKSPAAFFLVSAFFFLIHYLKESKRMDIWFSGLCLAALICIRLEMAVILLPFIYGLVSSKQMKAIVSLLVPFVLGVGFVLGYNAMYWQAELAGGYEGSFAMNPFPAISGVLFSPGKSLFIFNPVLILLPLTLRFFWQSHDKPIRMVWAGTTLLLFLVYSFWGNWWGGWGYGARHFVPLVPLLLLPLAECFSQEGKKLLVPLFVLFMVGVVVQIAGASIAFHDVIHTWMQSGFTETQLIWEPQLNPVMQHLRFMQAIPFNSWDFAVLSFIQYYPVTVTLPFILMMAAGIVAMAVWLYREIDHESKSNT